MRARRQVVTVAVFVSVFVFVLAAIAAIASPDGPSFSYGTMQSSCAPWDGPAVEMRLTTEPAECKRVTEPYISIAIWRGLPIHEGQIVKLGAGSDAGSAARCAKAEKGSAHWHSRLSQAALACLIHTRLEVTPGISHWRSIGSLSRAGSRSSPAKKGMILPASGFSSAR